MFKFIKEYLKTRQQNKQLEYIKKGLAPLAFHKISKEGYEKMKNNVNIKEIQASILMSHYENDLDTIPFGALSPTAVRTIINIAREDLKQQSINKLKDLLMGLMEKKAE